MRRKTKKRNNKVVLKSLLLVVSLGIIPLAVSLVLHMPVLFADYHSFTPGMLSSAGGFVIFLILFLLFGPPAKSYILEHELSHVLFALVSGVKVKSMSLKRNEGFVKTERVNIIIALAPYSLPLYTLVIICVFKIVWIFFQSALLSGIFHFFIGISLSFHVIATIHYIQIDQPDLKRYGYFSSLIFIFTWSVIVLALIIALMFKRVEIVNYFDVSFTDTLNIYRKLFAFIKSIPSGS